MSQANDEIFALIADLLRDGTEFCVATIVRTENATSAKAGAKAVVLRDGTVRGFLGGGCVQGAIRRATAEALAEGRPRLIRVKPKDEVSERHDVDGAELHKSSCPSGGTVDFFIEPMRRAPHLVVCGASPVAIATADLGKRMGYRIGVAAAPGDLARFGEVDAGVEGFDLTALEIGPGDHVIVATQGKRDHEALSAALRSAAGYVAFVGSRRKARALRERLLADGLEPARVAALHSPAGLDIGAITPEEIALSLLAEVVQERRRGIRADEKAGAGSDAA